MRKYLSKSRESNDDNSNNKCQNSQYFNFTQKLNNSSQSKNKVNLNLGSKSKMSEWSNESNYQLRSPKNLLKSSSSKLKVEFYNNTLYSQVLLEIWANILLITIAVNQSNMIIKFLILVD